MNQPADKPERQSYKRREIDLPANLHPATQQLVLSFAVALADKLHAAEEKYGYDDGWSGSAWEDECRERLYEHLEKGDPRDVANYCAFMWHHGWNTKAPVALRPPSVAQQAQPSSTAAIKDYEEVLADHRRLVRELDVLLNGEEGAAKQASLCDIVAQVRRGKNFLAQPTERVATITCIACKGAGTVRAMTQIHGPDNYEVDATCPACNGTGAVINEAAIPARIAEEVAPKATDEPFYYINGYRKRWFATSHFQGKVLSYEEVVELSGQDSDSEVIRERVYTVTYKMPHGSQQKDGSLIAGQSAPFESGMVFNVTRTNNA